MRDDKSITICLDDATSPEVCALINNHILDMHSSTPPEHAYAVDAHALQADDISFWTAWAKGAGTNCNNDILLGCGALRQMSQNSAEVKSMRTHHDYLRQGVAARILEHIIAQARLRQFNLLSLETGTGAEFNPAISLYEKYGFQKGEAFGNYSESPYNQFYHIKL